jgi:hypothetical protein
MIAVPTGTGISTAMADPVPRDLVEEKYFVSGIAGSNPIALS